MSKILSVQEFEAAFPDEISCRSYLIAKRWPDGFECPRCGHDKYTFISTRDTFECLDCHYQCSVIAGTVFENTKLPLRTWFWAFYFVVTTKKSISAAELGRKVGINRYKNAWLVNHKIHTALDSYEAPVLKGITEADETLYGPNYGEPGRSKTKATAVAAVEVLPATKKKKERPGALRINTVSSANAEELMAFIKDGIEVGTTIRTDGLASYHDLGSSGYDWEPTVLGSLQAASLVHPWVHVVFRNLKMVLNATHAGVSRKHLNRFLRGFEFRFNHRGFLGAALGTALRASVKTAPITYRDMIN